MSKKSDEGKVKKLERNKIQELLLASKGNIIDNKMQQKDIIKVLQVICLRLGITDKDNIIQ